MLCLLLPHSKLPRKYKLSILQSVSKVRPWTFIDYHQIFVFTQDHCSLLQNFISHIEMGHGNIWLLTFYIAIDSLLWWIPTTFMVSNYFCCSPELCWSANDGWLFLKLLDNLPRNICSHIHVPLGMNREDTVILWLSISCHVQFNISFSSIRL